MNQTNPTKLSILIPTHKRPELFKRCFESVILSKPQWAEVIVLNDSFDVDLLNNPLEGIKGYYKSFNNLSENYKFLLEKASGEYVYYLEDDDYLNSTFFKSVEPYLDGSFDLLGGNYYPTWNDEWVIKCTTQMNIKFELDDDVFQLGQFIMKRDLAKTFRFPKDSHIHNDRKLIEHILTKTNKVQNIPKVLYYQTTDGGDNISFPESTNYYG